MTKLQLTDIDNFVEQNKKCIIIFGDTSSILTKTLFSVLKDLGHEIRVLDTEEYLESYTKYRIRTTPLVHVYINAELTSKFVLPINREDVKKCLNE
jgi:hypothetical protein